MKKNDSLLERNFIEYNLKNLSSNKFESPDSNSFSLNKKEGEKRLENYIINNNNKSNKKISTSTLQSGRKINRLNQRMVKDEIYNNLKNKLFFNSPNYNKNKRNLKNINSCPVLVFNNFSKTEDKFWNANKHHNNNANLNFNLKSQRSENGYGNNKLIKKMFQSNFSFYSNKGMLTFSKKYNPAFLLEKRIKIIKKPKTSDGTFKSRNKKIEKDKYDIENNYHYKQLFERRLPLNDLRYYKAILFEEFKGRQAHTQYIPRHEEEKVFTNTKINSTIKNTKISKKYPHEKNNTAFVNHNTNNNNSKLQNDNNYETIEFHGNFTKIVTKLQEMEIKNDSRNKKEDFHKVMKHPLLLESFGYKYLRNLNRDYKIYKNPLDDRDLINKIHHLIINPNTIEFRNGNLMYNSAGFYRKRNASSTDKNYKLLSKRGYVRLKNYKINRFKQDVEDNIHHVEHIRERINLLMEKNKKIFKEHKEELENEEKKNYKLFNN